MLILNIQKHSLKLKEGRDTFLQKEFINWQNYDLLDAGYLLRREELS